MRRKLNCYYLQGNVNFHLLNCSTWMVLHYNALQLSKEAKFQGVILDSKLFDVVLSWWKVIETKSHISLLGIVQRWRIKSWPLWTRYYPGSELVFHLGRNGRLSSILGTMLFQFSLMGKIWKWNILTIFHILTIFQAEIYTIM